LLEASFDSIFTEAQPASNATVIKLNAMFFMESLPLFGAQIVPGRPRVLTPSTGIKLHTKAVNSEATSSSWRSQARWIGLGLLLAGSSHRRRDCRTLAVLVDSWRRIV
jgi:hypothetical protein